MVTLFLAMAALQPPAPPGPPRTTPISPATWSCEIRDQQGRQYLVRGSFDEIPPDGSYRLPKGRVLEDASGTFVVGEHNAGLMNRGRPARFYVLAVQGVAPAGGGRNYYHFYFRLYPDQPGVVMIEQQQTDRQPEVFRGFGAGICRSQFGASQREPQ
jgi:hypothetical protein